MRTCHSDTQPAHIIDARKAKDPADYAGSFLLRQLMQKSERFHEKSAHNPQNVRSHTEMYAQKTAMYIENRLIPLTKNPKCTFCTFKTRNTPIYTIFFALKTETRVRARKHKKRVYRVCKVYNSIIKH